MNNIVACDNATLNAIVAIVIRLNVAEPRIPINFNKIPSNRQNATAPARIRLHSRFLRRNLQSYDFPWLQNAPACKISIGIDKMSYG
jgi:hypothetical protein